MGISAKTNPDQPLRVLLIEDSPDDAALVLIELNRYGLSTTAKRVDTAEALKQAIAKESWDVVISDYTMPGFDGREALLIVKAKLPEVPFVVVSGTVGEDVAVDCMRAGATDYLLKDQLARLGAAVERDVGEARRHAAEQCVLQQRERALRESEARYRELFDNAPIGLGVADSSGTLVAFNRAILAQGGYTAEDIGSSTNVATLYANSEDRDHALRLLTERGSVDRLETQLRRKDGGSYTVLLSLRPVTVGGERCVQAMVEDLSERKQLESQLLQAQKMEAIGRLAGGVAHDFNNLLTAIISFAGFVRDSLGPNDPRRDDIREVLAAGDRAAGLTSQLLAFSRRQPTQTRVVNFNECLLTVEKLLRRTVGEHITFVVSPAMQPAFIKADPHQLDQVLLNLAVNARDAMPEGGSLNIGATITEISESNDVDLDAGHYVQLSVRDTGTGMDDATRERIFDPFFTTKPKDKGTGLGLSTCFGIVKQAGGAIAVDSAPGKGTCFTLYFPVCREDTEDASTNAVLARDLHGHETVLVVEDEPIVRKLAVRSLEEKGYRVLTAADGTEGLAIFESNPQEIALVLTDVVLPKMSGFALGEAALKMKPGLSLLLMSGYTDDLVLRDHDLPEGIPILWKPFTPAKLQSAVRKALDGETRSLDQIEVALSKLPVEPIHG